jgi:hypothetical protein
MQQQQQQQQQQQEQQQQQQQQQEQQQEQQLLPQAAHAQKRQRAPPSKLQVFKAELAAEMEGAWKLVMARRKMDTEEGAKGRMEETIALLAKSLTSSFDRKLGELVTEMLESEDRRPAGRQRAARKTAGEAAGEAAAEAAGEAAAEAAAEAAGEAAADAEEETGDERVAQRKPRKSLSAKERPAKRQRAAPRASAVVEVADEPNEDDDAQADPFPE